MSFNRPEPYDDLHDGVATTPRPAATVLLLRGGADRLEVLIVQRSFKARFMGGFWVFPGGAVDADESFEAAAARELHEEVAIELDAPLVPFARWIAPPELKTRFDTWFFLAPAPADADASVDGTEVIAHRWIEPAQALELRRRNELEMAFPTIKNLEALAVYTTADAALAAEHQLVPVMPRVVGEELLLPGEPGYPQ